MSFITVPQVRPPSGVYAYISTPAGTTCTLADTYYFLEGTFTNEVLEQWEITPPLTYKGGCTCKFEVQANASVSSDTANNLLTLAFFKNGVLQANSEMSVYIKNTSELYTIPTVDVIEFEPDDNVEIRVKASQAGSVITAEKFTTSLHEFFNK